jgi:hypothetical protein
MQLKQSWSRRPGVAVSCISGVRSRNSAILLRLGETQSGPSVGTSHSWPPPGIGWLALYLCVLMLSTAEVLIYSDDDSLSNLYVLG